MFWILQAQQFLHAWWTKQFALRDSYFLATLKTPEGWRWQVPVMAVDEDAAHLWLAQRYPADEVIDVQLQRWG